ncbi:hypothetical protein H0H93_009244 [Arthromyces matolae]|nr:hypothetical protein H0H93_009244 [Arthromyces matolae]
MAGTASMSLSMNPSLRIDGKIGSLKGVERKQQPWIISSHKPGPGRTSYSKDRGKGRIWKYSRNFKGGFRPVVTENFDPKPSLIFGLENSPPFNLPKLEIQGAVFWSIEKQLLSTLRSKNKGKRSKAAPLPANLNFLHRISMTVDMQELGETRASVIEGELEDEIPSLPPTGGSVALDTHHLELSNDSLSSKVEIVVRQAVEGRVEALTPGESSALPPFPPRPPVQAPVWARPAPTSTSFSKIS